VCISSHEKGTYTKVYAAEGDIEIIRVVDTGLNVSVMDN
jgi:hypothetical protein